MKLEQAIQLRENGYAAEAMKLLRDLLKENPNNPTILYQYAWACDAQGLEQEAAPYYELVLRMDYQEYIDLSTVLVWEVHIE